MEKRKKKRENSEYKRVLITTLKRRKKKNSEYNRVVITTLKGVVKIDKHLYVYETNARGYIKKW